MKKILAELRKIVLANPLDLLVWNDGKLELKSLNQIPAKSRGAVARIERNTTGVKVVFHDKLKAAELLLRYDQQQTAVEENNLLVAILNSTTGTVDTTDIDEMRVDDENGIFIAEGS